MRLPADFLFVLVAPGGLLFHVPSSDVRYDPFMKKILNEKSISKYRSVPRLTSDCTYRQNGKKAQLTHHHQDHVVHSTFRHHSNIFSLSPQLFYREKGKMKNEPKIEVTSNKIIISEYFLSCQYQR